jgi:hypothetical protein
MNMLRGREANRSRPRPACPAPASEGFSRWTGCAAY